MKERLSVYLDPQVMRSLIDYADRRGKSKSLIAEAAIASFLSPDAAERQEATFARRLDRLFRQMERLERDVGISVEALALFVRFSVKYPWMYTQQVNSTRMRSPLMAVGNPDRFGASARRFPVFLRRRPTTHETMLRQALFSPF